MVPEQNKRIPDDEIDFRSIGRKILWVIWYPFALLLRNVKTTIAFILLGILLSVASKYLIPKTYRSSFLIRPHERNDQIHLRILGDIQALLGNGDRKSVARELKLSDSVVRTILTIRVTNFAFAKNRADSSNTSLIELGLTDPVQMVPVQNALLRYLDTNPYYAKNTEYQKKSLELRSELIEQDIALLDSLKRLQLASYNKLKTTEQNGLLLKDLVDPTSTYTLSLERVNQKVGLVGQNLYKDNFELLKSVVPSSIHVWPPRILFVCLVMVPLSLLLCIVFLLIKTAVQNHPSKK